MRSIFIKVIVLVVLLILGLQTNYQLFYYILFSINQKALTETVCEKKSKTCNACCYLNKQIQEEKETEIPALPEKQKKNTEIKVQEYFISTHKIINNYCKEKNSRLNYHAILTSNFTDDIYHPPEG